MIRSVALILLALAACRQAAPPPPVEAIAPDPKSPQAAAALVARYFALLETRDYTAAHTLWPRVEADARVFHAEIGAPSLPEGACGSIYVQVPVHLVGVGIDERRTVNVRRVNDVDGSTEAQRRWHIESIEP